MNALLVSENRSRLGEAEDDEILMDPPLPPAWPLLKVHPSTEVEMEWK